MTSQKEIWELHEAVVLLEVAEDFHRLTQAPSCAAAQEVLASLKLAAKKNYKRLALKHHPDVGGTEEKMTALSLALARLEQIEVRPRPAVVIHIVSVPIGSATTPASTASVTTGWY